VVRTLRREDGLALVAALLAMLLAAALGVALVLTTTIETSIAGNYLRSVQAQRAAETVLEQAMIDLAAAPDWTAVINGTAASSVVDGPPSGSRALGDGSTVDLDALVNTSNCGRVAWCTPAQITAVTATRPWGANNPVWRLYVYGPLSAIVGVSRPATDYYVVTLVGDDPAETDGDPLLDGGGSSNPGAGVLAVRAESVGPRGARAVLHATISRASGNPRFVSWRILTRRS
jgi:hypothetical protein